MKLTMFGLVPSLHHLLHEMLPTSLQSPKLQVIMRNYVESMTDECVVVVIQYWLTMLVESESMHYFHFSGYFYSINLLYILPLESTPNLSSSSDTTYLFLCIFTPSLASSLLRLFFLTFKLSSCHPPVPLCVQRPLEIILHCHHALVAQQHLYPGTQ